MRPKLISILCILLFVIGSLALLGWIITLSKDSFTHELIPLFSYVSMLITGMALWKMMKWGYYFYLIIFFINVTLYWVLYADSNNIVSSIVGLIIVSAIVIPHWSKLKPITERIRIDCAEPQSYPMVEQARVYIKKIYISEKLTGNGT